MSTRDEHLQKALQHAPDNDVAPSEITRKALLAYADKALKTRQEVRAESWFVRVKNTFNSWQIPRWQLTGMGSLAASLLVVVMIWHENPNDPIQIASAPDAAQTEVLETTAAPRAEAKTTAPKMQEMVQGKLVTKAAANAISTKQETEAISQYAPEAPTRHDATVDADSMRRKDVSVPGEAATASAPVAAAPISEPLPPAASAETSVDTASKENVDKAANMSKTAKNMAAVEQAETKRKADLPSVIAAKPSVPISNSAMAITLIKQGGQTLANKDIQAGRFRILYLGNINASGEVDDTTGYRKEEVYVGDEASSTSLPAEIEAYNQTMREWHLNH